METILEFFKDNSRVIKPLQVQGPRPQDQRMRNQQYQQSPGVQQNMRTGQMTNQMNQMNPRGQQMNQQLNQQMNQQQMNQQQMNQQQLNQQMNPQNQNRVGQPPTAQKRARWFVALFDYDPATMSPNPDACEEELPFSEGDHIKVWGDKDADGFYWGECRGRRGFVPHNMVMEVEGRDGNRERWGDIYANTPVKRMVALYDYDPQELSPNVDAEVSIF